MKLTITKGLPASGKTTWAKTQNAHRINKDDLRSMLNNGIWSKHNEKHILEVRDILVRHFLVDHDVIVDDTNLAPKHEKHLREIANEMGAEFEIKDFTSVSVDECIKRDQKRANYVGEKVIRGMYNQFLRPAPLKIEYNPSKPDCILCDIDGTMAIMGDRSPYNDLEAYKDTINTEVANLVRILIANGENVIFLSGRKERSKIVTTKWLRDNDIDPDFIYMRSDDDDRKDSIVKREIYEKYIKPNYNVKFVLDDRDQVVEMWRQLGLTCLQVAEGNF